MHSARVFVGMLICVAPILAQQEQSVHGAQKAAATSAGTEVPGRSTPEMSAGGVISPDAPVLTLEGPCGPTRKGARQSECKSVVTRAEIEIVLNVVEPNATPAARRQFAINYARLVAASEAAKRQHLEKDPEVAKQLLIQQKLASMQVLANALYHRIEAEASNVSIQDVEKYYAAHQSDFERGAVRRLVVPKRNSAAGTQILDASILKSKADELRTRAAAGEDFDKLQVEAYENSGSKTTISTTLLNTLGRANLPAEESKVFDLDPGQVTPVLDFPTSFVVLKLESKKLLSLEDAKPMIVPFLQRERAQQVVKKAEEIEKSQFNLQYFGLPSAPALVPPPQVAGLAGESGMQSDSTQRTMNRRPTPRKRGMTALPSLAR
jgi:hypothetical protein